MASDTPLHLRHQRFPIWRSEKDVSKVIYLQSGLCNDYRATCNVCCCVVGFNNVELESEKLPNDLIGKVTDSQWTAIANRLNILLMKNPSRKIGQCGDPVFFDANPLFRRGLQSVCTCHPFHDLKQQLIEGIAKINKELTDANNSTVAFRLIDNQHVEHLGCWKCCCGDLCAHGSTVHDFFSACSFCCFDGCVALEPSMSCGVCLYFGTFCSNCTSICSKSVCSTDIAGLAIEIVFNEQNLPSESVYSWFTLPETLSMRPDRQGISNKGAKYVAKLLQPLTETGGQCSGCEHKYDAEAIGKKLTFFNFSRTFKCVECQAECMVLSGKEADDAEEAYKLRKDLKSSEEEKERKQKEEADAILKAEQDAKAADQKAIAIAKADAEKKLQEAKEAVDKQAAEEEAANALLAQKQAAMEQEQKAAKALLAQKQAAMEQEQKKLADDKKKLEASDKAAKEKTAKDELDRVEKQKNLEAETKKLQDQKTKLEADKAKVEAEKQVAAQITELALKSLNDKKDKKGSDDEDDSSSSEDERSSRKSNNKKNKNQARRNPGWDAQYNCFRCNEGHEMSPISSPPLNYGGGWQCDYCKRSISSSERGVAHCSACKFDICVKCQKQYRS